jgi:xylulokinase
LDLSTRRIDILKALLEGVALEMRLNLEILEKSGCLVNELRLIGGGAKSQVWNQLRADVTGKPISILNVTEAGCKGGAILAIAAHTKQSVIKIAGECTQIVKKLIPDPGHCYDEKFRNYKELYPALKSV